MTSDSDIVDQVLALQDGALHFAQSGHGSLLVLLHGSLCDYRYWRWQLPELSRAHTVVAPSLRGYWPQAYQHEDARFSIERHAADIIELIARLSRGSPVHLLGHSRGARVALEVALRAPDSLASLMLADPGFRFEGDPQTTTLGPDIATLLQSDDPDAALAAFVDAVNGPDTWRRMVRWFKTMVSDNRGTLYSQLIEKQPAVARGELAKLAMPVLLIGGAESPQRYVSRLDILQETIPQARRLTIPQAAHGMNLANPKAFNLGVAGFMQSVDA